MAYDPGQFFKSGQEVGKSKQSSLSRTSDYMSELFKKRDEEATKTSPMELLMYKNMMDQNKPSTPLDTARIENLEAKTRKLEDPSSNLSVSQQIAKDKRTQALFDITENNKLKKGFIDRAKTSLPNIPSGQIGKFKIGIMKQFDPSNPILADWQNLKSVLMDATLMNIGRTKGAISDKEMQEFQTAAANDDLVSVSRMGDALDRLRGSMDAQEFAARQSYKQIYGEDPASFLDDDFSGSSSNRTGNVEQDYDDFVDNLIDQGTDEKTALDMADREFGY